MNRLNVGVRRERDPARTREALLDAASREFAGHGLAGAGVAGIAAAAGVNKRMIYHYFGNKEGLFRAVIERVYAELSEAAATLEAEHDDPVEGVRELVRFIWQYYREHPHAITLLNAENLAEAKHIKASPAIAAMGTPFLAAIERLLARGRTCGAFRDDTSARELYISIVALSYYYLSNRHTLSVFFGSDIMRRPARERWAAHVETMVLDYLCARHTS